MPGLSALVAEVLAPGRCAFCGACLGLCPYLRAHAGRIVALFDCDIEDGRCWQRCPRAGVTARDTPTRLGVDAPLDPELGPLRGAWRARAEDPEVRVRGQNGGAVSALLVHALATGEVDRALVTARGPDHTAHGRLVASRAEVLACAGSGYAAGPTLAALEGDAGDVRVAVVALPCQAQALARRGAADGGPRVTLVLGLFCTFAFDAQGLAAALRAHVGDAPITRLDVSPPPGRELLARVGEKTVAIALDDLRRHVRPACGVCTDLTARDADLAVGTVEGVPGWSLVLARSAAGAALVKTAHAAGALALEELPDGYLDRLRAAAAAKARRAEGP